MTDTVSDNFGLNMLIAKHCVRVCKSHEKIILVIYPSIYPSNLGVMLIIGKILQGLALACSSQAAPQFNGDPSLARILQEQRFNMGDGKFGAAYAQEDGVAFKEESSGNNERIGQYSYIDENGNTIVVKYSAGVNGFR